MGTQRTEKLTIGDLILANFTLAALKVAAVLPTQPLHVVMRYQQASLKDSRPLSIWSAYKQITKGQPLTALFRGIIPGMIKELGRNITYKGALIKGAPDLAERLFPQFFYNYTSSKQQHFIKSSFAGLIAGASDALLGGAIETYATYRSTSQGKYANASFKEGLKAKESLLDKVKFLYKGFVPTMAKGVFGFTTFFYVSKPIQNMTASIYNLSPKDKIPWYSTATSAIATGFAVALIGAPMDIIKTQAQMPGSKNCSLYAAFVNNYKNHGIRGVIAGLPAKVFMISMGWGLNFFATRTETTNKTETKTKTISMTKVHDKAEAIKLN